MTSEPEFLTPEELAARWRNWIHIDTLRAWRCVRRRRGPAFIKVGQRVLYPLKDVKLWEQSMKVEAL
jgi:hypothetical protein